MFDVGDIVRLASDAYYSGIYGNTDYVVTKTKTNGTGVQVIAIKNVSTDRACPNTYSSKNFKLVKKTDVSANAFVTHLVLDTQLNVVAKVTNEVDALSRVKTLLAANPTKKYHIYTYSATGKYPDLPVTWECLAK